MAGGLPLSASGTGGPVGACTTVTNLKVWAGARARVLEARATGSPAAALLVGGLPELYDLDRLSEWQR